MTRSASRDIAWTDRRRHPRKHLLWAGALKNGTGPADPCVILDISAGGAMVRLPDDNPRPAKAVLAHARLGQLAGRIVWQHENVAGLRFGAP